VERGEGERTVGDKAPMTRGLGEEERGTWLCTTGTAEGARNVHHLNNGAHSGPGQKGRGEKSARGTPALYYECRRREGCTMMAGAPRGPGTPDLGSLGLKGGSRGPAGFLTPFWRDPRGPGPQTPIYGVRMGQSRGPVGYLPISGGYLSFEWGRWG
jgi:hypothetical protein